MNDSSCSGILCIIGDKFRRLPPSLKGICESLTATNDIGAASLTDPRDAISVKDISLLEWQIHRVIVRIRPDISQQIKKSQ
jgi:hypothetical protein